MKFIHLLSVVVLGSALAQAQVTLTPTLASPQLIGTTIPFTASVSSPVSGHTYDCQFSVGLQGLPLGVRRDFSPASGSSCTFSWTPRTQEGNFVVQTIIRDTTSSPATVIGTQSVPYVITGLISPSNGVGAVVPTANPLVALFAGPACVTGNFMRVRFGPTAGTTTSVTGLLPCNSTTTMNFYVAGMLPSTAYSMRWETVHSSGQLIFVGPNLSFNTGSIPTLLAFPTFSVVTPPPAQSLAYPIVLWNFLPISQPYLVTASDLSGNILWYYPTPVSTYGRNEWGGNFFALTTASPDPHQQILQEIDLAGNVVLQTNASIVSEQLVARGLPAITGFHHEVRRLLPSNNILVLAAHDVASTSAQGGTPTTPVDIIGDMVLVLDPNMQLLWAWDSFAHLDINRAAILGETCIHSSAGCPPFSNNFTVANDWLHSNAAQLTADGNIILSMRHQDWVIKINYANGAGDGSVLWHLGVGGDFSISTVGTQNTADIGYPWFSHQHDPEFQFGDASFGGVQVMTIFDDGNTRQANFDAAAHSRGQIYAINEAGRAVNLNTNADLGSYSFALGSSQLQLYSTTATASYLSGIIGGLTPSAYAQMVEVDLNGNILFNLQANSGTYRAFRVPDLYTPLNP